MSADSTLMRALDFTPEDLRANRSGELTARQRKRLSQARWANEKTAVFAALCIALAIFVYLSNPIAHPAGSWHAALLFIPLAGWYLIVMGPLWHRLNADLASGRVTAVTGYPQVKNSRPRQGKRGGQQVEHHYLAIGGEIFSISQGAFNRLDLPYSNHRAYFAPQSKIVLSMEPVAARAEPNGG